MNSIQALIIVLAKHCDNVLNLSKAKLSDEYFYQSLPLCVIDAVYSIGVKYESTKETVKRYCNYFNLQRIKNNKDLMPNQDTQESIEAFFNKMNRIGVDTFTEKIFDNRQRTSTNKGILKSEAAYRFAKTLKNHDVNYFQDVTKVVLKSNFEKDIKSIPGQRSGISLRYFYMLSGSNNFIKPDRHLLKFLRDGLNENIDLNMAEHLISGACNILKLKYNHLSPRLLDHSIWNYQRNQTTRTKNVELTYNKKLNIKEKEITSKIIVALIKKNVVLCSADASPRSQRKSAYEAGYFYPGAKWVGAVRNTADRTGCKFVIITTEHGMVNPYDIITPYDKHGAEYKKEVKEKLSQTIPNLIGGNNNKLVIFYAGGVPRDIYLEIMLPVLYRSKLDLLTFGKPNMYDVDKIENIVELLTNGEETPLEDISKILKLPDRLEYFSYK